MPITISKTLINKLPENERREVKKTLWNKSGKICFLCGGPMVEATDKIVADHDVPEAEGGATALSNLNLVHDNCNAFKRNHETVNVRPYLQLMRLINDKGGAVKYDEAAVLLDIRPNPVDITDRVSSLEITTPDSATRSYPVFTETNKDGTYRYCFADLPANAIYNDDDCQPRTIRPQHLWQIYNDICRNPLHEPPACRLEKAPAARFDGTASR